MISAGRVVRAGLAVPLLLLLLAGLLVAHGLGPLVRHAGSVAHAHVGAAPDVREPVGGIASPPCRHPGHDDGGKDAGHGDPSCVAPGAGAGPTLPAVLPAATDPDGPAPARHGVDQTTAAERGPPSLAELQRLRL